MRNAFVVLTLAIGILLLPFFAVAQDFWVPASGQFKETAQTFAISSNGYIFAGTDGGGVYRSTDNGDSWAQVNAGLTKLKVWSLAINSNGYIFAGTGDGSVYRSMNNGDSWTWIPISSNGTFDILALAINPDGQIFAGTSHGYIFQSMNNGNSWTQAIYFEGQYLQVLSLAINSSGYIFAGTNTDGIFRSTNNGASWVQINTGLTSSYATSLAINSSGHVFAGSSGIFRSTDNGDSWTSVSSQPFKTWSLAINLYGHIFASGDFDVYRSTDGGDSWMQVNVIQGQLTKTSAIAINSSGHIFVGTIGYGGLFRSINNGNSWTPISAGPATLSMSLAINSNGHIFAATNGDGVFRSKNKGDSWVNVLTKLRVTCLAMNSNDHIFAGTNGGGIYRSTDNGENWTQVNAGLTNLKIWTLTINSSGHIFAGTDGGGVYRSTDNADNWLQVNIGLSDLRIGALAIGPSGHVFAGSNDGGVFRSNDNGGSWMEVNTGLANRKVLNLSINSSGHIFAGTRGGGIFRSTDNGDSWISVYLEGQYLEVWSFVINSGGHIFAGTTGYGIFRSLDNGESWAEVNTDLPNTSYSTVVSLAVDSKGYIFAAQTGGYLSRARSQSLLSKAPVLISPRDGATDVLTIPTLQWNRAARSVRYTYWVSNLPQPSLSPLRQGATSDTFAVVGSELMANRKYYWQVSSTDQINYTHYSPVWSFTTGQSTSTIPDTPTPISPPLGATGVATNPTLRWNRAARAVSYNFKLSTNSDPNVNTISEGTTADTLFVVTELTSNTRYYWNVFAKNDAGLSPASATWSFTTEDILSIPDTPTLVAPPNGATRLDRNLTLQWNKAARASSYEYKLSTSANPTTDPLLKGTTTDTSIVVTALEGNTQYYWHVLAKNNAGLSSVSDTWSFTTAGIFSPPDVPTLVSPQNGSIGVEKSPTLRWNKASRAEKYTFLLSINPNPASDTIVRSTTADTFAVVSDLASGTQYYWYVWSTNTAGTSRFPSPTWSFTTIASTDVSELDEDLPADFGLEQNFPNPFNPSTSIFFAVPHTSRVTIKVFNLLGKKVATVADQNFSAGHYQTTWHAEGMESGVYFYRMQAEGFVKIRKLLLVQ